MLKCCLQYSLSFCQNMEQLTNDIFKNKKINAEREEYIQNEENNNNLPIEIKKENFFTKLINFIKKLFYK